MYKKITQHHLKGTLLNLLLRGVGIFAKFALIIYISKSLSLETLGLYNIISVTVAWSVFLLGFEFYSYSLRQIVGEDLKTVSVYIYNQSIFHLIGFTVLVIASPLFVYSGFIPVKYLLYFLSITLFDQLSQECYRVCLALNRSQFANFIYLIKSGLWVYPLLFVNFLGITVQIDSILQFWLGFTMISLILGIYKFRQLQILAWYSSLDTKWLKEGVKTAFPFFIISIAQLIIDFSDRYMIDAFLGKKDVGIYSFFYGIANVPINLITNVIVAQYYSKVINNYKFETSATQRIKTNKSFLYQNLGLTLLVVVGCVAFIHPLLTYVGKSELSENLVIFYMMLLQAIIFAFQIVIQTILYAKHKDHFLLVTALLGALLNIIVNVLLIPRFGIIGATISTIISMAAILLSRSLLLIKNEKNSI